MVTGEKMTIQAPVGVMGARLYSSYSLQFFVSWADPGFLDRGFKGGRALSPFFGPLQKPKYQSCLTTISSSCLIS